MKKNHLEAVWKKIEAAYLDERINSERCLQALLYQDFTEILGSDYLIFVEPSLISIALIFSGGTEQSVLKWYN